MTNSKSTKRALVSSAIATLMCIVMLIGTTFAWFTDTASTNVNKIQSGTLKVDIVDAIRETSLQGESLSFVNKEGSADILWEPGATFKTTGFKIKNNGNLALKYKLLVNGIDGDSDLLKVIKFSVLNEDGQAVDLDTYEGHLTAGGVSEKALYIKGHMDEAAGNEYQKKELDGLSITVVATQDTVESDSKDNQYDKDAAYPVVNVDEMKEAFAAGGVVSVSTDIKTNNSADTADARVIISQPTTLNLDAKIITPDGMGKNGTNFCALIVDANTTINATANGGINTGVNGGYGLNVRNDATLTINNGYYYGGGTTVQVQEGTLVINGGTFACEPFGDPYGYNFMINCIDSAYKNGTAKVIIKGGTFINFDPSNCSAEGAGTNFVAAGYKVTSEKKGSDIYYTVVPNK